MVFGKMLVGRIYVLCIKDFGVDCVLISYIVNYLNEVRNGFKLNVLGILIVVDVKGKNFID